MLASVKEKAMKAKDYSVDKATHTRDHMVSQPSKKINWDPNHKKPPPPPVMKPKNSDLYAPPPSRTSSTTSSARNTPSSPSPPSAPGPPPLIRRDSRPDSVSPPPAPPPICRQTRPDSISPPLPPPPVRSVSITRSLETIEDEKIDWTNLSPEDKQVFFSWLDEFFARYLNLPVPPRSVEGTKKIVKEPATPLTLAAPAPRTPSSVAATPCSFVVQDFIMSYPPSTQYGSAALDVAMHFSPSAHWDDEWYKSSNMGFVPGLKGRSDTRQVATITQPDPYTAVFHGSALFADLSIVWFSVSYPLASESDPNDTRTVRREARYLPRPSPMDRGALVEASETYGETIASFAESFVDAGEYCARGECWDLAAKAIECFEQYDYVPPPIPSTLRTHGHLIFEGKAMGKGNQVGRWRGGDDRVRRGDIVEWRKVRFVMSTGRMTQTKMLGNPDHTAVIVSDAVPSVQVSDGQSLKPADLGTLEVVDQSVSTGIKPKLDKCVMSGFEEGEVWIYRPVSMQAYIGCALQAECPEGINALRV
ncbi:uncharacterized protein B0H18DRAFT_940000 [Fomitopsis serialis]|uniref:uncharacterized protein n=1 Tax=Fomitopsis serialis TaxID=139415 RepID=UPI00200893F2|nr:uncharacterized protein B0H18DRAFT_940000 [Neoantrodia serialis]KAH9915325.1 hypothetical protein B0H18DRAFT_940000 [Neoantrodia serialis]